MAWFASERRDMKPEFAVGKVVNYGLAGFLQSGAFSKENVKPFTNSLLPREVTLGPDRAMFVVCPQKDLLEVLDAIDGEKKIRTTNGSCLGVNFEKDIGRSDKALLTVKDVGAFFYGTGKALFHATIRSKSAVSPLDVAGSAVQTIVDEGEVALTKFAMVQVFNTTTTKESPRDRCGLIQDSLTIKTLTPLIATFFPGR